MGKSEIPVQFKTYDREPRQLDQLEVGEEVSVIGDLQGQGAGEDQADFIVVQLPQLHFH